MPSKTDSPRRLAGAPSGWLLLVAGLVIGLLGSYADNLLGGASGTTIVQVLLWISSGAAIVAGAQELRRRHVRTGSRGTASGRPVSA